MEYVTKVELETPRSSRDIKAWVDSKLEEIGRTEQGKRAVRLRIGLAKELVEEALPLAIFCDHYFDRSDAVFIHHNIGSQNYDARIEDNRNQKTPLKFIEITQAHEGENAHLRMLHLENEGHVNVLGDVKKSGNKQTGITIEVKSEAVEHSAVVAKELRLILNAAIKKSGKEYPPGTGLVIMFDDSIAFKNDDDIEHLKLFVREEVLQHLINFQKVFVVSWSSKIHCEFDQNAI